MPRRREHRSPPLRLRQALDTLAGGWHDVPSVTARVMAPLRRRTARARDAALRLLRRR